MDVEKRGIGMGMNDYNGDMRKGGRGGGMAYRPPGSKEAAPDAGSYYDKVMSPCHISSLCPLCLSVVYITFSPFLLFYSISYCLYLFLLRLPHSSLSHPPTPDHHHPPFTTTQNGLPLSVTVTDLAFDQSGLVPWGGGSFLSVLTTHYLQVPFPLQPHYSL